MGKMLMSNDLVSAIEKAKSVLSNPVKYLGRSYWIRYVLQLPSTYAPSGDPHIFLFSTRRGGSTLLSNVIYSQPGLNYIDQPFDLYQANPHKHLLPRVELSQFIYLDRRQCSAFKDYFDKLLTREYVFDSQWQLWDKNYHWRWNRYVVKILSAKAMIEWFEATYAAQAKIVYSTRHPIPVALSIIQRKTWGVIAEAYLSNAYFVEQHLSERLVAFGYDILNQGSLLEKHVLEWCLENLVPLRKWREKPWVTVSYEKLVTEPEQTAKRLCRELDLPNWETMVEVIKKPSYSTTWSSQRSILTEGPEARLSSWKKKIDEDMIRRVDCILDSFEIDLYKADDHFPKHGFG